MVLDLVAVQVVVLVAEVGGNKMATDLQLKQQFDYLVVGNLINANDGPQRFGFWVSPKDASDWREAEAFARAEVAADMWFQSRGLEGKIWIAAVLQLNADGEIVFLDGDAFYADDNSRPKGTPVPTGYVVPKGFEGIIKKS